MTDFVREITKHYFIINLHRRKLGPKFTTSALVVMILHCRFEQFLKELSKFCALVRLNPITLFYITSAIFLHLLLSLANSFPLATPMPFTSVSPSFKHVNLGLPRLLLIHVSHINCSPYMTQPFHLLFFMVIKSFHNTENLYDIVIIMISSPYIILGTVYTTWYRFVTWPQFSVFVQNWVSQKFYVGMIFCTRCHDWFFNFNFFNASILNRDSWIFYFYLFLAHV